MALAPLVLPSTGWRGLWIVSSLACSPPPPGPGASGRPIARPTRPDAVSAVAADLGRCCARRCPGTLALAFGLWALQHFALIIWLPTFLDEQRHMLPARWPCSPG